MLTNEELGELYNKLYPYTQIDNIAKAQHITNIHKHLWPQIATQNSSNSLLQPIEAANSTPVDEQLYPANEMLSETKTAHPEEISESESILEIENSEKAEVIEQIDTTDKTDSEEVTVNIVQLMKCPWCNSNLVLRTATRGEHAGNQFY